MDHIKNPYAPGAGSPPPELAGRHEVIRDADIALRRLAAGNHSRSPILVGLRGVGKTVLLVRLQDIAEKHSIRTIVAEAHEGKTLPELLVPGIRQALFSISLVQSAKDKASRGLRVLKSFMNGVKVKVGEIELGLSIEAEPGTADSGDLEHDLPDLLVTLAEAAAASSRPVAIFIDEMQYLSQKEFSALIMSMHKITQRKLPIMMIGAGLPQILGLAGNSKSYAERLFLYPPIGALSEADAVSAIVAPARLQGVSIEAAAVRQILDVTKRYPYFLQQWAYEAWNIANGSEIKASDVYAANNNALSKLDESFFKVRFERCTPSEKRYMRALAELGAGAFRSADVADLMRVKTNSVAPTRAKLIKKGMIYAPAYGDTEFTVPLFDEYMKRAMPNHKF